MNPKTEEEKRLLHECVEECNALPPRSPQKKEIYERYAQTLTDRGYHYTADEIKQYYNNNSKRPAIPPEGDSWL